MMGHSSIIPLPGEKSKRKSSIRYLSAIGIQFGTPCYWASRQALQKEGPLTLHTSRISGLYFNSARGSIQDEIRGRPTSVPLHSPASTGFARRPAARGPTLPARGPAARSLRTPLARTTAPAARRVAARAASPSPARTEGEGPSSEGSDGSRPGTRRRFARGQSPAAGAPK